MDHTCGGAALVDGLGLLLDGAVAVVPASSESNAGADLGSSAVA